MPTDAGAGTGALIPKDFQDRIAMSKSQPRVGIVSLGCPKALVDPERILTQLRAEGYDISDSMPGPMSSSSTPAASSIPPAPRAWTRSARPCTRTAR